MLAVLASEVKLPAYAWLPLTLAMPAQCMLPAHMAKWPFRAYIMQEHARLSEVCKERQLSGMLKRK